MPHGSKQCNLLLQTRKRPHAHGNGPMPRYEPVRTKPIAGTELREPERGGGGRTSRQAGEDDLGTATCSSRTQTQPIGLRPLSRGTGTDAGKGEEL